MRYLEEYMQNTSCGLIIALTVLLVFGVAAAAFAAPRDESALRAATFRSTDAKAAGKTLLPSIDGAVRGAVKDSVALRRRAAHDADAVKDFAGSDFLITDDTRHVTGAEMAPGAAGYIVAAEWEWAPDDRDIVAVVVPLDPEAPLIGVSVDSSYADSFAPDVAYAPDLGVFLIVWEDFEGQNSNIYGALVSEAGEKLSDSFLIAGLNDEEFAPAVAYTGFGDFVVFFGAAEDYSLVTGYIQLYSVRVNLDGESINLGAESLVADLAAFPDAARVNDDRVLVAYQVLYADNSGPVHDWDWDVYASTVSWNGAPEAELMITGTSEPETDPSVAYNPVDGIALAVWESAQSTTDRDLAAGALPVSASGAMQTPTAYIAYDSNSFDVEPDVAWDDYFDVFLATWRHDFSSTDGDILTMEFSYDGLSTSDALAAISTDADQLHPTVAALDGWFLIVWQELIADVFNLVGRFYEHGAACTPPAAPATLQATPGSSAGQVRLTWAASSGATEYRVYYSGAQGTPASGASVGNVTQVTVSGLTPNTDYCFEVTAVNACGESGASPESCARTPDDEEPPPGPGRILSIPENITPANNRIEVPVQINNASGVLSFRVAVCYPSELSFVSAQAGSLTGGWSLVPNNEGGMVLVSGSGTAALSGSGSLVRLTFSVPSASQGGSLSFCRPDLLKLNDGQIALGTPDGGSYLPNAPQYAWGDLANAIGDQPGIACDGIAGGLDAALMLRWDVALLNALRSCPNNVLYTRPNFPPGADLNGDGILGGLDASLALRYDVGLIDCFPADTNCNGTGPGKAFDVDTGGARTLSMDQNMMLPAAGAAWTVPVRINNADGVYSYRVQIEFPANRLEFVQAQNTVMTNGWLGPIANSSSGVVTVSGSGANAAAGSGVLLNLVFTVKAGSGGGTLHFGPLTRLNDGAVQTSTVDGSFASAQQQGARLEVTPNPAGGYDFGAWSVGETPETLFTVRNTGDAILTGAASVTGPAFSVVGSSGYSLAAGQSMQVRVRFAPQEPLEYTGSITFTGGDGPVIIDLYGSATPLPVFSCGAASGAASGWGNVVVFAGTALALAGLFVARASRP